MSILPKISKPINFIPYEKSFGPLRNKRINPNDISLQKTTITFGANIIQMLNSDFVEILFDNDNRLIAFKASTVNNKNAVHLTKNTKDHKSNRINAYKITQNKHIVTGMYQANWSKPYNMAIVQYEVKENVA